MKPAAEIKAYNKERDDILRTASLEQFMSWAESKGHAFSAVQAAEIAFHKMRTACAKLPLELRLASDKWLRDRKYESWL